MTATRRTSPKGYDHVYQITVDRGICFYTAADCLVWFSLMCILARLHGIRILAVCIMLNHYHIELHASSPEALSAFMRNLKARFTRMYNRRYNLTGPLFGDRFKNACKYKEQKVRENFLYICNNPVVKHAVPRAEQYRWNFLAYMQSTHPFSSQGDISSDERIGQVMSMVRTRRSAGRPLDYAFFDGLYSRLSDLEKKQILDYIITQYNVIDYAAVKRMWGSFEQLIQTLQTVRGAEYDIEDDTAQEDYRHYYKMIRIAADLGYDLGRIRFGQLSPGELRRLAFAYREKAGASQMELAKFLHKSM